jgi:hypothetical protein
MKAAIVATSLLLAVTTTAGSAPGRQPARGTTQTPAARPMHCPMCGQMRPAGQQTPGTPGTQGGMMNPQMMAQMQPMVARMMQMMAPATITVAEDGSVYVLRGGTLYRYSRELKLLGSTQLPAPNPATGAPAAPAAAGDHEGHF